MCFNEVGSCRAAGEQIPLAVESVGWGGFTNWRRGMEAMLEPLGGDGNEGGGAQRIGGVAVFKAVSAACSAPSL